MAKTVSSLIVIAAACICVSLSSGELRAQEVIYSGELQHAMPYHVVESNFSDASVTGHGNNSRQFGKRRLTANKATARLPQSAANGQPLFTLPRGRRYIYGSRYFGNINNRFYGPQYGNF